MGGGARRCVSKFANKFRFRSIFSMATMGELAFLL